jgi:hypothetical protein
MVHIFNELLLEIEKKINFFLSTQLHVMRLGESALFKPSLAKKEHFFAMKILN